MKAEERKKLEQNEILDRLGAWWKRWNSSDGKSSYTLWIVLGAIVLTGGLIWGYRYFSESAQKKRAALWAELDRANSREELEGLIEKNKGTAVANVARLQLTRLKMIDGMANLGNDKTRFGSESPRAAAIKDLISARTMYDELTKDMSDDADVVRESLLSRAKIEESLVAVRDPEGASAASLGDLDRAAKLFEEFAAKAGDTTEGKAAAERAKEIKDHKDEIQKFYEKLNEQIVKKEEATGPILTKPDPNKTPDAPKPPDINITPIQPTKPSEPPKPMDPPLKVIDPPKTTPAPTAPAPTTPDKPKTNPAPATTPDKPKTTPDKPKPP